MKKTRQMLFCFTLVLSLGVSALFSATARAEGEYGPKGKRFGVGIILGEPTGFTFKGFLSEKMAFNGIASWSFVEDAFVLIGDVIYEFVNIPVDTDDFTLPFFAGAGGKIAFGDNGNTTGGVRIPVGLALQWTNHPVEVFFEIAPGMQFAPATEVDITGGVGARFYF